MTWTGAGALSILVLTYAGVAVGRIPGLRLDRAGIALLGGAAMIAIGAIGIEDAYRAINLDTITLLLGMMIVVAHLKVSGAFRALGGFAIEHAHAVGRRSWISRVRRSGRGIVKGAFAQASGQRSRRHAPRAITAHAKA